MVKMRNITKKILNKTKCISHLEEQERCSLAKGPNIIRLCLFVHILRSEQFMEWTYNVNWIFIIRAHNKLNDTYVLHTLKLGFVITGVVKFSQYVFLVTLLVINIFQVNSSQKNNWRSNFPILNNLTCWKSHLFIISAVIPKQYPCSIVIER